MKRVIKRRLQKDVSISENQFGFMPGKSTIEAIYLLKRLMGLYRDRRWIFIWCSLTWKKHMIEFRVKCYGDA